jgi:hypothetical protein
LAQARTFVEVYRVELEPLNGSGVRGSGTVVRISNGGFGPFVARFSLSVAGLESGRPHSISIDNRPYLFPPGECPPASAAADDPSPSGLGDDIISAGEAARYTGGTVYELPPVRTRGRLGFVRGLFRGTNDPRDSLGDALLVRGLTVHGQYEATVPVACSRLTYVGPRSL